jgi:multidrug efflux pump subunit AcrA (membrane-fusion protein)
MDELQQIEARLRAAHDGVRQRETLQQQRETAQRQLDAAHADLARLQDAARLEADDVQKLEAFSGRRVWSVLKGSRTEDLEREQAEAELARGRAAEAKARCDVLRDELERVWARLDKVGSAEGELMAATQAKEEFLVRTGSPAATRLIALAEEHGRLHSERREVEEALDAGLVALNRLDALCGELGSASGWSTYDTFLGGGMISTAIKHDHMDRAAELSRAADQALAVLGRELGDVGADGVAESLTMSDGTRFLDMWFDNVFTDLSVRSQIRDAEERAHRIRQWVEQSLAGLRDRHSTISQRLEVAAQERTALLA